MRTRPGRLFASALDNPRHAGFPDPLIDLDHLVSGGPPPDGIPPIDNPRFADAVAVDWLDEQEPVLSLTVAGETRAYPLQVMTWHEIVNDTVGGVNLVMYDRQTDSLWPQLTGQASVGVLTGTRLKAIPMGVVGWAQFLSAHPEALVLTRDTGIPATTAATPTPGTTTRTVRCWSSRRALGIPGCRSRSEWSG